NGGQRHKSGQGKNKWKGEKNKGKSEYNSDQHHQNGEHDQNESSSKGKESFWKSKNGGKKSDKSKIQCYSYDKWGHYAFECRSKGKKKQDNEAHLARHNDSDSDGDNKL
ncbi:hypothetical protein A2U01_0046413, partial [Trifolium medium]|nr:hypothetical protein [Trifolium medium]